MPILHAPSAKNTFGDTFFNLFYLPNISSRMLFSLLSRSGFVDILPQQLLFIKLCPLVQANGTRGQVKSKASCTVTHVHESVITFTAKGTRGRRKNEGSTYH